MVGLMQIMIYLFCIYLVYKGIEIFQIAFVSDDKNRARKFGVVLGILSIILAVFIGFGAVLMTEEMVNKIGNSMPNMR